MRSLPANIDRELALHVRGEPEAASAAQAWVEANHDSEELCRALDESDDPGRRLASLELDRVDLQRAIDLEPPFGAPLWALDLGPAYLLRESWQRPQCIVARRSLRKSYGGWHLPDKSSGTVWSRWWSSRPLATTIQFEPLGGRSGLSEDSEVLLWVNNGESEAPFLVAAIDEVRSLLYNEEQSVFGPPA